ncbi:MAG: HD domain-containing protein [Candidatus Methanofastidiosa archaeon]|jgi:3'-5' exoribonuclease|nr:HD domain-containing protein [Candidatus Methanofastidiosa archaeon]
MEDKLYIADMKDGMAVDTVLVVLEKELLDFKSKPGRYLQVKFKDKTGEMWGKCWDGAEDASERFNIGDVVRLRANVTSYNGHVQVLFTPTGIQREEVYDISYFIDSAPIDTVKVFAKMQSIVGAFSNTHLRMLLAKFFEDQGFVERFLLAPCAKSHHHNYLGGLIEHTYGVMTVCNAIARSHVELDRELLLAGAILHDVGKIRTYDVGVVIDLTPEGGLFDHIVIGFEMVRDRIRTCRGFPEDLERRLLHMILSHHGKKEWGSPTEPMIPEACALYHADLCDSQTAEFLKVREELDVARSTVWSGYSRKLNKYLYLGEHHEL